MRDGSFGCIRAVAVPVSVLARTRVAGAMLIAKEADALRAMILEAPRTRLVLREVPEPRPARGQVLLRVRACGVCRTDLHILDGELEHPKLPLVLGHQIVGEVVAGGTRFAPGARVGVPWLGATCGRCGYCHTGRENLCDDARFTGYDVDGGFAELALADERFCFPIPLVGPQRIPALLHLLAEPDMEERATAQLGELGVTTIASVHTPVVALSGGQRQAVAVARPTLWDAKILILDEPTAALGVAQTAQILELIGRLRDNGLGIVLISHNIDVVFDVSDRIVVLYVGRHLATFEREATSRDDVVSAILGLAPVSSAAAARPIPAARVAS